MFSSREQLQVLFQSLFFIAAFFFQIKEHRKINQNNFEPFVVEVNFFVNIFTTVRCFF